MVVSSETPRIDLATSANQPFGLLLQETLDEREEDLLFLGAGLVEEGGVALLGAQAVVDQHGGVAAVVEDHVGERRRRASRTGARCSPSTRPASRPCRRTRAMPAAAMAAAAWSCVEKMLQETQRTSAPSAFSVSISTAVWMVMCSEPAMRAPFKRLRGAVLGADGHEAGHLRLGEVDLLAAEGGQRDVLHDVVGGLTHGRGSLRLTRRRRARDLSLRAPLHGAVLATPPADRNKDINKSLYLPWMRARRLWRWARRSLPDARGGQYWLSRNNSMNNNLLGKDNKF